MISRLLMTFLAAIAIVAMPAIARAQGEPKVDPKADAKADTKVETRPASRSLPSALIVEVTLSRYQGDKRLSSLPYTLAVTPDGTRFNLRVGGQIPITTLTMTPGTPDAKPGTTYSYRDIGTLIDITAIASDDGRYRVLVAVEDSSIYPQAEMEKNSVSPSAVPAFRSFRSNNAVFLRDGQSVEYVAATDRITTETARISVKLTVIK